MRIPPLSRLVFLFTALTAGDCLAERVSVPLELTPEFVESLLRAIPGIASIAGLLMIVFYVAGVMATGLFGAQFPEWFGSLGASMYSLFQIMTLESWSMGIARPVMEVYPWAWVYFVPFILIATFTMLNLFIAIIVSTMQSMVEEQREQETAEIAVQVPAMPPPITTRSGW